MKRLGSCCGCCSPRTGAIVLAVLGLILFAVQLFFNIWYSVASYSMDSAWRQQLERIREMKETNQIDQVTYDTAEAMLNFYRNYLSVFLGISYLRNIISGIVNALMLFGVMTNRHKFILPWTIIGGIGLIFDTLLIVGVSITLMVYGGYGTGFALLFLGLIFALIGCYFWCVVHTVYKDIRDAGVKPQNIS